MANDEDYGQRYKNQAPGGGASPIRDAIARMKEQHAQRQASYPVWRPRSEWMTHRPPPEWRKTRIGYYNRGTIPGANDITGRLGPKKLPPGAVGWTPQGDPYYGGNSPLTEWWARVKATWNQTPNVENPTALTYAGKYAGLAITGLLAGFQEATDKAEQGINVISELSKAGMEQADMKPEESAQYKFSSQGMLQTLAEKEAKEKGLQLPEKARRPPPNLEILSILDAAKYMFSPVAWSEKKKLIDDAWNAGRVMYSSSLIPTVQDDYLKRYNDGENPYLLQMEMENPWAELPFQILLDPMNFVGGITGKVFKAGRLKVAAERFLTVPEFMTKFVQGTADDAPTLARKLVEAIPQMQKYADDVTAGAEKIARSYQIWQHTAGGKAWYASQESAAVFNHLIAGVKNNPDEVLEYTRALINLTSKNPNETAEAMTTLLRFPGSQRPFFSESGVRTSAFLRKLLTDDDGVLNAKRFLDDLAKVSKEGGVSEVAKFMGTKIDDATAAFFPTALKTTERTDPIIKAMAKTHDRLYNKGPWRAINSMFATVYMALNPGFAFRNYWSNLFHVAVDEGADGLRAVFRNGAEWEKARSWMGGVDPRGAYGFSMAGGESLPEMLKGRLALGLSEKFEEVTAKGIVAKTINDSMPVMVQKGLKQAESILLDAGFTPTQVEAISQTILSKFGDTAGSKAALIEDINKGMVNLFRAGLNSISPADRGLLNDFGLGDEVIRAATEAETVEEAVKIIDTAFDDLLKVGDGIVDDVSAIPKDADAVEVIHHMDAALQAGDLPEEAVELANDYFTANHNANLVSDRLYQDAYMEAITTLVQKGVNPAEARAFVDDIAKRFKFTFNDITYTGKDITKLGFDARAASGKLSNATMAYSKAIDVAKGRDELVKIWKEAGLPGEIPTTALSRKEMKSELWIKYWRTQKNFWQDHREVLSKAVDSVVGDLGKAVGFTTENIGITMRRKEAMVDLARKFDKHMPTREVWVQLQHAIRNGKNAEVAATYWRMYGLGDQGATATAAGRKLDNTRILNVINKMSPPPAGTKDAAGAVVTRWTSLDQVPPKVSEKALLRYSLGLAPEGEVTKTQELLRQIDELIAAEKPGIEAEEQAARELFPPGWESAPISETDRAILQEIKAAKPKSTPPIITSPNRAVPVVTETMPDALKELDPQGWNKAIKELQAKIDAAGANPDPADLEKLLKYRVWSGKATDDAIEHVVQVSNKELPEYVSTAMRDAARGIMGEIGGLGRASVPDKPGIWYTVSQNPDWYSDLYNKSGLSTRQIHNALKRIIDGKDAIGKGQKAIEQVKRLVVGNAMYPGSALGEDAVGNPGVLMYFGKYDEAFESFMRYMEDFGADFTDDDWIKLAGGQENLDELLRRMDTSVGDELTQAADNIRTPAPQAAAQVTEEAAQATPGVSYVNGKWEARAGERIIGSFNSKDEAAAALDNLAKQRAKLPEAGVLPKETPGTKPPKLPKASENIEKARLRYGIAQVAADAANRMWKGAPPNQFDEVIETFSKQLSKADAAELKRLAERGTAEDYINAIRKMSRKMQDDAEKLAKKLQKPIETAPYTGGMPSGPRVIHEQKEGLEQLRARVKADFTKNWGRVEELQPDAAKLKAVDDFFSKADTVIQEARVTSNQAGVAARDFILHAYPGKRNFDLALSYLMPWHFWYGRTYAKWMQRIVSRPQVISAYAHYRNALAKAHADAPEWWRYQVNSNELLGINSKNPFFFNLEATLNPLNAMISADFNDPRKRVNWFTSMVDDLGKFGPSLWTPIQFAIASGLYLKGEEDAAARWGTRLIPQTRLIRSATALAGVGPEGGLELDPAVWLFSRGLDPYDERKAGRSLATLVETKQVGSAEAQEAAYGQGDNPLWKRAVDMAMKTRGWGDITSFLFGTGFRMRSQEEMEIDQMDDDVARFYETERNLSSDEIQAFFSDIRKKYPFYDTVILSRKTEEERDRLYGYSVLNRIPPGQKDDMLEAVGISSDLMSKFYDDSGRVWEWQDSERQKFMGGVVELGAILEVPPDATLDEWRAASTAFQSLDEQQNALFGKEIQEKINTAYAKRRESMDAYYEYLDVNPDVKEAMAWEDKQIVSNPLIQKYYGSMSTVQSYFRSVMYDKIEAEVGADIWDQWDEYGKIQLEKGQKAASAYFKSHPDMSKYLDLKDFYEGEIAQQMAVIGEKFPKATPATLREIDEQNVTTGQRAALEAMGNIGIPEMYTYSWGDWEQNLSEPMKGIIINSYATGQDIPEVGWNYLEKVGNQMDADPRLILALMLRSIKRELQPAEETPER